MIKSLLLNSKMDDCEIRNNVVSWDISHFRFDSNSNFAMHTCLVSMKPTNATFINVHCNLVEKDRFNPNGTIFWEIAHASKKRNSLYTIEYKPHDLVWWPIDCSNPQKLVLSFENSTNISLESIYIVLKIATST